MSWDELYETARRDRRRRQGHPRRRRVHGHDQEAVRRDRRRVDRGEPPRLPEPPLHDARHGGVHRRRHPLRRDDPAERRRRDAVRRSCSPRRASSRASRSTPARSRSPASRRDGHRGPRRAARAPEEYRELGARFAKWRAVITIGEGIPTDDLHRGERARARALRGALPGGGAGADRRARGADGRRTTRSRCCDDVTARTLIARLRRALRIRDHLRGRC